MQSCRCQTYYPFVCNALTWAKGCFAVLLKFHLQTALGFTGEYSYNSYNFFVIAVHYLWGRACNGVRLSRTSLTKRETCASIPRNINNGNIISQVIKEIVIVQPTFHIDSVVCASINSRTRIQALSVRHYCTCTTWSLQMFHLKAGQFRLLVPFVGDCWSASDNLQQVGEG